MMLEMFVKIFSVSSSNETCCPRPRYVRSNTELPSPGDFGRSLVIGSHASICWPRTWPSA